MKWREGEVEKLVRKRKRWRGIESTKRREREGKGDYENRKRGVEEIETE